MAFSFVCEKQPTNTLEEKNFKEEVVKILGKQRMGKKYRQKEKK